MEQLKKLKHLGFRELVAWWALVALAVGVPVVVGAVLLFVSGWLRGMQVIGLPAPENIHHSLWGWVSDYSYRPELHNNKGQLTQENGNIASPNALALAWFMGWIFVYFLYQIAEGITLLIREFARLSRGEPRQEVVDGERQPVRVVVRKTQEWRNYTGSQD